MFSVLNDEIRRLSRVLEEFDRPFDADPASLQLYKKVCLSVCLSVCMCTIILMLCYCYLAGLGLCRSSVLNKILDLYIHKFLFCQFSKILCANYFDFCVYYCKTLTMMLSALLRILFKFIVFVCCLL